MRRLRTVHAMLQEANGLGLLADPLMEKATAEIVAGTRPRHDIQRDIKQKERAREMLVKKYKTGVLPEVSSALAGRRFNKCGVLQHLGGKSRHLLWASAADVCTHRLPARLKSPRLPRSKDTSLRM